MNRILALLFIAFTIGTGLAQDRDPVNANNNNLAALATFGPDGANIGSSSVVINPAKNVQGSYHLFKNWNNRGVFVFDDSDKKYLLRNINFNLDRQVFESKVGKDSVFTFSFDNVKSIVVNGREFKNMYVPGQRGNKTFEIVFEGTDFAIVKENYITITEGSDNPMINRPSKFVKEEDYFVRRGNSMKPIRLKKSTILKLAGSEADQLEDYVKKNRLSYKEDADVRQMLNFALN